MSLSYQAVGWNRQKKVYDRTLLIGLIGYLAVFIGVGGAVHPDATAEALLVRALGTAAILLLHVVLIIGPLCRLDTRFLPLLYNRRHLGVTMFLVAFAHGAFSLLQFHGFGDVDPLTSLLISNTRFDSVAQFPFHQLGAAALLILFVMAATSHDFWLANLTAPVWKTLHMGVYLAYALVIAHVVLGVLQAETSPVFAGLLGAGVLAVTGLQVVAALRERRVDHEVDSASAPDDYVDAAGVGELRPGRARVVTLAGERVALFLHEGAVSALSSVCQHQNGPLGEGCIRDGLVTCPWHGYQYRPTDGASPPPFTESVPTFRVRVEGGRVLVDPRPLAPGTAVEPARLEETPHV